MKSARSVRGVPPTWHVVAWAAFLVAAPACMLPGQTKAGDGAGDLLASCGAQGLVDDCEDNNNQCKVLEGRNGYWYTYASPGTTVEPEAGGTFTMSPGGVDGSKHAARVYGQLAYGQDVYGGMGVNLTDPKGPYDASQYKGIAFWAKKGPEGYGRVRFKAPDISTDQDGGVCSNCSNDFGAEITLYDAWEHFVIPWRKLKQQPDWGMPRPHAVKPHKLMALQWQASTPGVGYDIWVDQIELVGCGD